MAEGRLLGPRRRFDLGAALCQGQLLRVPRGGQGCPRRHRSQVQAEGPGGHEDGRDAHDAQGRLADCLQDVQVSLQLVFNLAEHIMPYMYRVIHLLSDLG